MIIIFQFQNEFNDKWTNYYGPNSRHKRQVENLLEKITDSVQTDPEIDNDIPESVPPLVIDILKITNTENDTEIITQMDLDSDSELEKIPEPEPTLENSRSFVELNIQKFSVSRLTKRKLKVFN